MKLDPKYVKLTLFQLAKPSLKIIIQPFIGAIASICFFFSLICFIAHQFPVIIVKSAVLDAMLSFALSVGFLILLSLPVIALIAWWVEDNTGMEMFREFKEDSAKILLEAKTKVLSEVIDEEILK